MGKIPQSIVDRILNNAKILDVAKECLGSYDPLSNTSGLRKKGTRYIGLCPFHDDSHATNFSVYPPTNCYKCFACGAKGGPVEFVMKYENLTFPDAIRWLGKLYKIDTDMEDFKYTPPPPRPTPPPLPTLVLPTNYVNARRDLKDDNFVKFLRALPWDGAARSRIDAVLEAYRVGHSKNGHTIFWQIDKNYKVRTGKMIRYKTDGHRDKQPGSNDWVHSILSRKKNDSDPWPYPNIFNPDKQEMRQCYFGEHLLNVFPKANINIVESEKTAIIMSIAYGDPQHQLWIACGGKFMISQERMEPLMATGNFITLFPDRDAVEDWKDRMDFIDYNRLRYNDEFVTKFWKPEDGEKADIADILIRWVLEGKKHNTLDRMLEKSDALRLLNDKLNLKEDTPQHD